jgi:hypothetical protein
MDDYVFERCIFRLSCVLARLLPSRPSLPLATHLTSYLRSTAVFHVTGRQPSKIGYTLSTEELKVFHALEDAMIETVGKEQHVSPLITPPSSSPVASLFRRLNAETVVRAARLETQVSHEMIVKCVLREWSGTEETVEDVTGEEWRSLVTRVVQWHATWSSPDWSESDGYLRSAAVGALDTVMGGEALARGEEKKGEEDKVAEELGLGLQEEDSSGAILATTDARPRGRGRGRARGWGRGVVVKRGTGGPVGRGRGRGRGRPFEYDAGYSAPSQGMMFSSQSGMDNTAVDEGPGLDLDLGLGDDMMEGNGDINASYEGNGIEMDDSAAPEYNVPAAALPLDDFDFDTSILELDDLT